MRKRYSLHALESKKFMKDGILWPDIGTLVSIGPFLVAFTGNEGVYKSLLVSRVLVYSSLRRTRITVDRAKGILIGRKENSK